VDVSIICIRASQLANETVRLSRSGGRVNVFAGLKSHGWAEIEANLVHYRQVLLSGSANSRRADYETALRLIESGRIDTASMVTHRSPLSAVAMDAVTMGAAIKVAVLP
jgi:L-iditol 2-dehydrogenase